MPAVAGDGPATLECTEAVLAIAAHFNAAGVTLVALPSVSIVVEMENIKTVEPDLLGVVLESLAAQLKPHLGALPRPPQIIFSYPGQPDEREEVLHRIRRDGPGLAAMDLDAVGTPDGRYYEMKNAGAARADGGILIFVDSDVELADGWLGKLLEPFNDATTMAVSGHTFLRHDNFASRTLALIWIFALERGDDREAARRSINANNAAFRLDWFRSVGGFPYDPGFKVSCALLYYRLRQQGLDCVRADARARHEPLRGWRFLLWRAAVTGRDADRKYRLMKSPSRARRLRHAGSRWGTMLWRSTRRILGKRKIVGLPLWQVPAALLMGWGFYSIAFVNQAASAIGLFGNAVEHVPDYAEVH